MVHYAGGSVDHLLLITCPKRLHTLSSWVITWRRVLLSSNLPSPFSPLRVWYSVPPTGSPHMSKLLLVGLDRLAQILYYCLWTETVSNESRLVSPLLTEKHKLVEANRCTGIVYIWVSSSIPVHFEFLDVRLFLELDCGLWDYFSYSLSSPEESSMNGYRVSHWNLPPTVKLMN